jgi:hypothetical protein
MPEDLENEAIRASNATENTFTDEKRRQTAKI